MSLVAQNSASPVEPLSIARKRRRRKSRQIVVLPTAAQWREVGFVTLAYLLAIAALLWPYTAWAASAIPGRRDALLQIWIGRWVEHALVTDPLRLYDGNAFYPLDHSLAYSDANVPVAFLMAPIQILTGNAILAYNVAIFATFLIAAGGMYALIRHWTGNRAVAFLAGLAFAFLPYRYAHLWHLNQLGHAWTPWVLLALLLLVRRPARPLAVALGLLVAVESVSSFYLAFQVGLILIVALIALAIADPRARTLRFLGHLALAGMLALAIVVPLALPYLDVREGQGLERTLDEAEQWQARPASYLKVAGQNRVWSWLNAEHNGEDTLWPGGVALFGAVAGVAFWRRRRAITLALLVLSAIAFIVALGPTWTRADGREIALPYRFLFEHFPFFAAMRVAARFGVLVDFAIVALAGLGLAGLWNWLGARLTAERARQIGPASAVALSVLICVELASVPIPVREIDRSPATAAPYEWLAAQPGQGAVMEFPATPGPWATGLMMYWSTTYWKPLVQGTSGFTPLPHREFINAFVAPLVRQDGHRGAELSHPTPDNVGLLQDLGVQWVVLQRIGYAAEDWPAVRARASAAFGGGAVFENEATTIFRVPAGPTAAPQFMLNAPSSVRAGGDWAPTLEVTNPLPRWALIYVKAPVTLTVTWRDGGGQVARRDVLNLPVAVVGPPGTIRCALDGCALDGRPRPAGRVGLPAPGRYTVDLVASGGLSARASTTVEVQAATAGVP
ncbi:MAG TPA: DUF6044 family protein [Thermomicrobiales bacterium]